MGPYIVQRLMLAVLLALGAASLVFFMIQLAPGDVVLAALGETGNLTPEQIQLKREELGQDRPLLVQYADWLSGVVRGDLGSSFVTTRSVSQDIALSFPRTIELVAVALAVGLCIGIPAGVFSATYQNRWPDYVLTSGSILMISVPSFVSGTLLLLLFGLRLRWLPVTGFVPFTDDPWLHIKLLILPGVSLGLFMAAVITRMTRSSMLEAQRSDYVRTARSKGLPERIVLFRHTLKNALIPVVTLTGIEVGGLLGGTVIIEYIFTWPGISTLLITAANRRDYPVVQGVVLVTATAFVLVNLAVDLLNAHLDPRIRYGRQ
jgi:peptide/nickel transport system permease protein